MKRLVPLVACLLAACAPATAVVTVSTSTTALTATTIAAMGAAKLVGTAIGPAGVAGGNIVASNSGRLIGHNGASIVASNVSRYVLAAVPAQLPIKNAIVYLTDPQERFFAVNGEPLTATTDAQGRYDFVDGVPVGQVVIVNVILADNKREVGYTGTLAGENRVDVSLATTYVTEFLRARAAEAGKTMAAYDLKALAKLTALTEKALAAGDLAEPDLTIGKINELNQAYALAVGLNKQGLGDAWAVVLGTRVLAVTTVAGSGEGGLGGDGGPATKAQLYKPKSVTEDGEGNLYIADEGNHVVRRIGTDGVITTLAGLGMPMFSGDGGPAKQAGLWWPRSVLAGSAGRLYIADTLNMRIRRVNLAAGTIETVVGAPVQANGAYLNDFAGDGGPGLQAKVAGVRGLAFDARGGLIFADTWDNDGGAWHHLRRLDPDGTVTSLVGVDGKHGYNGDGKLGLETEIDYVNQIAVDGQDNIFFADGRNHRVRKYDAQTKRVSTIAGDGADGSANAPAGGRLGAAGDGGPATLASLSSPYGVAVDQRGRVFIAERGARRIRLVLQDGTIHTLAGGGTFTGDGEARAQAFSEPHDLYLEPSGNLLICDSRAAKIRRLWLQWGM